MAYALVPIDKSCNGDIQWNFKKYITFIHDGEEHLLTLCTIDATLPQRKGHPNSMSQMSNGTTSESTASWNGLIEYGSLNCVVMLKGFSLS